MRGAEAAKIVAFATGAAVTYGILHDMVTAHLCVEYFTVAHAPVFGTDSPVLLAIGWGILATWFMGTILGTGLAVAAQAGRAAPLNWRALRKPVASLMIASALAALVAGIVGAFATAHAGPTALGGWAALIPPEKHVAFGAAASAHGASYVVGGLGGLLIIMRTWRRRLRS